MMLYLISDNVDTQRGMRLAGIDGVVVHEYDEVKTALEQVVKNKSIGVLLVAEKLFASFPDLFKELKLTQKTPLVVEVPDRHGSDKTSNAIAEYVREAVGIKI